MSDYSYIRMLPPLDLGTTPSVVYGRSYPAVANTPVDVPSGDASALEVQAGWTPTCPCPCGPSTARPTNPGPGQDSFFLDTTLGFVICWNRPRKAWLNPLTGAAV
jgi:hypothetical protein